MIYELLLGFFLVVALALIVVILLQQGKGAVMGASFGAGASNTVFGSSGAAGFLTRLTTILAILFFSAALAIGYIVSNKGTDGGDDILEQAAKNGEVISVPSLQSQEPGKDGIPQAPVEPVKATDDVIPSAPTVDEAQEKAAKASDEDMNEVQSEQEKSESKDPSDSQ